MSDIIQLQEAREKKRNHLALQEESHDILFPESRHFPEATDHGADRCLEEEVREVKRSDLFQGPLRFLDQEIEEMDTTELLLLIEEQQQYLMSLSHRLSFYSRELDTHLVPL